MTRRLLVSLALLPLLLALAPTPARADEAKDELFKAWQAFLAVKSFRADIQMLEPMRVHDPARSSRRPIATASASPTARPR